MRYWSAHVLLISSSNVINDSAYDAKHIISCVICCQIFQLFSLNITPNWTFWCHIQRYDLQNTNLKNSPASDQRRHAPLPDKRKNVTKKSESFGGLNLELNRQDILFGQRERRQEGREAGQVVHQEKADGRTLICLTLCACKLFLRGDYFV